MTHFGFTKLVVADLDAAHRFYTSVFGFKELYRVSDVIAGRAMNEILYGATGVGGPSFALVRFADQDVPVNDELILGFVTEDLDTLCERLVAAGGRIAEPVKEMPQHGVRVAFVTDPEGHLTEVVQRLASPEH